MDQETWNRVREIAREAPNNHGKYHPRSANGGYLLSGLVRCTFCGHSMVGGHGGSRNPYYRCNSNYLADDDRCPARYIRVERLDDLVMARLKEFLTNEHSLAQVYAKAQVMAAQETDSRTRQLAALENEMADMSTQLGRIAAAIAAAGHSDMLLASLADLEKRKAQLAQDIAALPDPTPRLFTPPAEYASHAAKAWSAIEQAGLRDKQIFLRGLVDTVIAGLGDGPYGKRPIFGEIVLHPIPEFGNQPYTIPL